MSNIQHLEWHSVADCPPKGNQVVLVRFGGDYFWVARYQLAATKANGTVPACWVPIPETHLNDYVEVASTDLWAALASTQETSSK